MKAASPPAAALALALASSLICPSCAPQTDYGERGASADAPSSAPARPAQEAEPSNGEGAPADQEMPGVYGYCDDDGQGHVYIDSWELEGDGTASNMGRMNKWDYTWRFLGERDALGRPLVFFEPDADSLTASTRLLAYDAGLRALCEPGDAAAKYPRISDG